MRGATLPKTRKVDLLNISIHTPHAGSDHICGMVAPYPPYFNPHSPCGERLYYQFRKVTAERFQSTLPMRGATIAPPGQSANYSNISIHTPHAGSDSARWLSCPPHLDFNPHSPCGERPCFFFNASRFFEISIHTPHAGSDSPNSFFLFLQNSFQSTLPMRGATGSAFCSGIIHQHFNPHSPCGERRL